MADPTQLFRQDEDEDRAGQPGASDEAWNDLTSRISPDEEGAMDREAYSGAAQDIAEREGLTGKSSKDDPKEPGALGAGGLASAEGAASALELGKAFTADSPVGKLKAVKNLFWSSRRRKQATIGGGGFVAIATVIMVGLTIGSGPAEFIDMAQILTHAHILPLSDQGDDRFAKLARDVHYIPKGEIEKTRLGFISNKLANTIEAQMAEKTGFKPAYNSTDLNYYSGFEVDPASPAWGGMSLDEIVQSLQDKGVSLQITGEGDSRTVNLSPQNTGIFAGDAANRAEIVAIMQEAGYSGVSTAVGSRILAVRGGLSSMFHPLSNADTALFKNIDAWWASRNSDVSEGQVAPAESAAGATDQKGNPVSANDQAANEANALGAEGAAANSNPGLLAAYRTKVSSLIDPGTAKNITFTTAGVAALCLLRSVAQNAGTIEQNQVVLPLMRQGISTVATGSEVMTGKDVNVAELGKLSQQFTDPSNGSTWASARSIQADNGEAQTGPAPDPALTNIDSGTPFNFLLQEPINTPLGAVCTTGSQIALGALQFIGMGSGPVEIIGSLVVGAALSPVISKVSTTAANFLAGKAIDISSLRGANLGYANDYGTLLGANDLAISRGGVALNSNSVAQITKDDGEQIASEKSFKSSGLFAQLFDLHDYRSLASRLLIADVTPSLSQNVRNLANYFLSSGQGLASLPMRLFSSVVHAQSATPYDYGIPVYGFSVDDMNNPLVANPYTNAGNVATMLDSSQGPSIISKVQTCFGDTIYQDSNNDWNVSYGTTNGAVSYSAANASNNDCNDDSNSSWLQVRMFIFDTQTMDSAGCYLGDSTSCSSVDF